MSGPLDGIRVIESAMLFNGPVTGQMMADMGAEVIKIEPPVTGDISRGFETMFGAKMNTPGLVNVAFETANRNKKSIILNLGSCSGKDLLYKLIEKSDVFLTNLRNNTATKLKVDYPTLSSYNPKIVYASTNTFGAKGKWSDKRGYDMQGQAFSGAMWIFGDRDSSEPGVAVGSIFDQMGATVLLYGILAALVARQRTGLGQEVKTSLVGSAVHLQATNINTFLWQGRGMARFSRKRCRNPLADYYKCADGQWILLCETQIHKYWHDLCTAMGLTELENDARFRTAGDISSNYAELIDILDKKFAEKSRAEWLNIFSGEDFGYSPIYEYADMVNDPQILENDYIIEMERPGSGKYKSVGSPVQFSKTAVQIQNGAPEFGQHTEEVLIEILGLQWDDIAKLRDEGALG